jgi:hypothetical protein
VHGIGGSQSTPSWDPAAPPGPGVLAQGGREAANALRLPHGAGVIGAAGGMPVPPISATGSVGVFGQGADAVTDTVNIDGVITEVGPLFPGAGVLGVGGVPMPPTGPVAAGVIGLAGGSTAIPPISETGAAGVYGLGPTGVHGRGLAGPPLAGRGGVFESPEKDGIPINGKPVAQLRLVPLSGPPRTVGPIAQGRSARRYFLPLCA